MLTKVSNPFNFGTGSSYNTTEMRGGLVFPNGSGWRGDWQGDGSMSWDNSFANEVGADWGGYLWDTSGATVIPVVTKWLPNPSTWSWSCFNSSASLWNAGMCPGMKSAPAFVKVAPSISEVNNWEIGISLDGATVATSVTREQAMNPTSKWVFGIPGRRHATAKFYGKDEYVYVPGDVSQIATWNSFPRRAGSSSTKSFILMPNQPVKDPLYDVMKLADQTVAVIHDDETEYGEHTVSWRTFNPSNLPMPVGVAGVDTAGSACLVNNSNTTIQYTDGTSQTVHLSGLPISGSMYLIDPSYNIGLTTITAALLKLCKSEHKPC